MTHVRTQIRERIVTNVTGLTTTGSNVFESRVFNVQQSELPALLIYAKSEDTERDASRSSQGLNRNLLVILEGYAKGTASLDNDLDSIAEQVETALANDQTLNSLAKDCFLVSTEIDFNGEGDVPIGVIRLTFQVLYRTTTVAPGTAI